MTQLVRVKRLAEMLDVSVPTVWRWLKADNTFPRPMKIGLNTTVWDANQIQTWVKSRAGATESAGRAT